MPSAAPPRSSHKRNSKLLTIALEVVLISSGVFLGLVGEQWRESSRRHQLAQESLQRFRQEGRLASTLANPRAVFVLAADEDNGWPYIVMELMPGNTLDDLVKQHGPLPHEQAITETMLAAMAE